jgi:hypothetical protein
MGYVMSLTQMFIRADSPFLYYSYSTITWGSSRCCPYYNANYARNRRGYPTLSVPEGNGFSAAELGEWALGGVRRNPPPTYLAPMSLYTTPQRANSKPEQSQTQSTAVPGLGLALGPVFHDAAVAAVRSPSNP